jgi:SAM-dependent methyltransferase
MQRATRMLAARVGVRQFLDIGAGRPVAPTLHHVAQTALPDASVVYVDHDPDVFAHAGELLEGTPEGLVRCLNADVRDPVRVVKLAQEILDFDKPVAVSLIDVLHFLTDDEGAYDAVRTLVDALPSGSHLVLSQLASDRPGQGPERYAAGGAAVTARSRTQTAEFFTGTNLIAPGITWLPDWHPELGVDEERDAAAVPLYAGVGRKP